MPDCPVCGESNPPRRLTCSAECKKVAKAAYDASRYPAHRTANLARVADWNRANTAAKQAYDAAYRERTREHRLSLKRLHGQSAYHGDLDAARRRGRLAQAARRARKRGNGSYVVLERDLRRALHRARHRCVRCDKPFTTENPLEWDHVVPIRRGGPHGIGNLAPFCRDCNRTKGRRLLVEWLAGRVVSFARTAA